MSFVAHLPGRGRLIAAACLVAGVAFASPFAISFAQDGDSNGPFAAAGNTFTYQGRLESGGVPANGSYDFRFTLYSDAVANSPVGSVLSQTRTVTNGLFTAELDFGVGAFNGQERWIGVEAKQGAASYVALTPRTKLNATPYALYALNYPNHDHFGASWSGSAFNGLSLTNSAQGSRTLNASASGGNSTAILATNTGNCPIAPQTCYGVWGIATNSAGGSGFGGVGVRGDGSNTGVLGTGPQYGVYGLSDGIAIQAYSEGGTGLKAISGSSNAEDSAIDAQATNEAAGVRVSAVNGYGVFVESTNGTGIQAYGSPAVMGWGNKSGTIGVHGVSNNSNGVGVNGSSIGAGTTGVRGTGDLVGVWGSIGGVGAMPSLPYAGYFQGNVIATAYSQHSDARLKNNIKDSGYGLAKLLEIRPVTYALNSDPESKEHIGVIAQEIEQVLPGIVTSPANPDEMLAVNYTELIPVLIKAIQEQQAQIEALEAAGPTTAAQDVPASLASSAQEASDARFAAIEAELAAVRADSGGSNVPWLGLAVLAMGATVAGFALGRRRS